jgi:hypothetical protein
VNEEFWFQLVFIAIAVVIWLWRTVRRMRERARQQAGPEAPQAGPGPVEAEAWEEQEAWEDQEAEEEFVALSQLSQVRESMAASRADAERIRQSVRSGTLSPLSGVLESEVVAVLDDLEGRLEGAERDPAALASIRDAQVRAFEVRMLLGVVEQAVMQAVEEGADRRFRRASRLVGPFRDRMAGLVKMGSTETGPPRLLPSGGTGVIGLAAMRALARARAMPVDVDAAAHPHPLGWAALCRDAAAWTFARIEPLGDEIAAIHAALMRSAGMEVQPPDPEVVRRVFENVACTLALDGLWIAAVEGGFVADERSTAPSPAVSRRVVEVLASDGRPPGAPLSPSLEALVQIMIHQPLSSLGGHRIADDLSLRFDNADARRTAEVAERLIAGEPTEAGDLHLIAGAMRAAAESPELSGRIVERVDRALGLGPGAFAVEERRRPVPARGPRAFVSPRTVVDAVVLDAALSARRHAR